MDDRNLILTEKAVKNHSKRLHNELKTHMKDLSLADAQNLFSKALGFNDFHEMKSVLFIKQNHKQSDTHQAGKTNAEFFVVFAQPCKMISPQLREDLIKKFSGINLGWEDQNINLSKIDINRKSCSFHIDPSSEFAMRSRQIGTTFIGALEILLRRVKVYLHNNNHDTFHEIGYKYRVKNNDGIFVQNEHRILGK